MHSRLKRGSYTRKELEALCKKEKVSYQKPKNSDESQIDAMLRRLGMKTRPACSMHKRPAADEQTLACQTRSEVASLSAESKGKSKHVDSVESERFNSTMQDNTGEPRAGQNESAGKSKDPWNYVAMYDGGPNGEPPSRKATHIPLAVKLHRGPSDSRWLRVRACATVECVEESLQFAELFCEGHVYVGLSDEHLLFGQIVAMLRRRCYQFHQFHDGAADELERAPPGEMIYHRRFGSSASGGPR